MKIESLKNLQEAICKDIYGVDLNESIKRASVFPVRKKHCRSVIQVQEERNFQSLDYVRSALMS